MKLLFQSMLLQERFSPTSSLEDVQEQPLSMEKSLKAPRGWFLHRSIYVRILNTVGDPLYPISTEVFHGTGDCRSCWKYVK